jgi:hypothetical protein
MQLSETILLDSAVFIDKKQWQIGCGEKWEIVVKKQNVT